MAGFLASVSVKLEVVAQVEIKAKTQELAEKRAEEIAASLHFEGGARETWALTGFNDVKVKMADVQVEEVDQGATVEYVDEN